MFDCVIHVVNACVCSVCDVSHACHDLSCLNEFVVVCVCCLFCVVLWCCVFVLLCYGVCVSVCV